MTELFYLHKEIASYLKAKARTVEALEGLIDEICQHDYTREEAIAYLKIQPYIMLGFVIPGELFLKLDPCQDMRDSTTEEAS